MVRAAYSNAREGIEASFCFVAEIAFPAADNGPHRIETIISDNLGRTLDLKAVATIHAEVQPGDPYFRYSVFVRFNIIADGTIQLFGQTTVDGKPVIRGMTTVVAKPVAKSRP